MRHAIHTVNTVCLEPLAASGAQKVIPKCIQNCINFSHRFLNDRSSKKSSQTDPFWSSVFTNVRSGFGLGENSSQFCKISGPGHQFVLKIALSGVKKHTIMTLRHLKPSPNNGRETELSKRKTTHFRIACPLNFPDATQQTHLPAAKTSINQHIL